MSAPEVTDALVIDVMSKDTTGGAYNWMRPGDVATLCGCYRLGRGSPFSVPPRIGVVGAVLPVLARLRDAGVLESKDGVRGLVWRLIRAQTDTTEGEAQ